MIPIKFAIVDTLPHSPEDICRWILDVSKWSDFRGYGPLPGIRKAELEILPPNIVGARVRVTNTDGSSHVEEIVEWRLGEIARLEFREFSAPLSRLATGFSETWTFERVGDGARVRRAFELRAKSRLTRPVLWLISLLLRKAIAKHTRSLGRARLDE